jgi:hypothetical protein
MDRDEARARMLRLWVALSSSDAPTSIRTTQRCVCSPLLHRMCDANLVCFLV